MKGHALRFVASQLGLMLRSRWYWLGYACVNFSTPVSVRAYAAERGIDFDRLSKDERQKEVVAPSATLLRQLHRPLAETSSFLLNRETVEPSGAARTGQRLGTTTARRM